MNNPYDNVKVNEYGQVLDENGNVVLNEYGHPTYNYSQGAPIFPENDGYGGQTYEQSHGTQGQYTGQQYGMGNGKLRPGESFVPEKAYNRVLIPAVITMILGVGAVTSALRTFSFTGHFMMVVGFMVGITTMSKIGAYQGLKHPKLQTAKIMAGIGLAGCAIKFALNFIMPFGLGMY